CGVRSNSGLGPSLTERNLRSVEATSENARTQLRRQMLLELDIGGSDARAYAETQSAWRVQNRTRGLVRKSGRQEVTMTILKHLVLVAMAGVAAGCSNPRMAAPVDLEPHSDSLEVENRSSFSGALVDESFDVGEYKVT